MYNLCLPKDLSATYRTFNSEIFNSLGDFECDTFFHVWLINLCLLVVQCSRFDRVLTKLLQCCRIAPVRLKSYLRGYGGQPTATALRDETDNEM